MIVSVKLLKKETGEKAVYKYETDFIDGLEYLWNEGNFSCDCNRELFFCRARGIEEPDNPQCGENRFELVSMEVVNA